MLPWNLKLLNLYFSSSVRTLGTGASVVVYAVISVFSTGFYSFFVLTAFFFAFVVGFVTTGSALAGTAFTSSTFSSS